MEKTLFSFKEIKNGIPQCVEYFKSNFGKSRFHHVEVFFNQFLTVNSGANIEELKSGILDKYNKELDICYPYSPETPGIRGVLSCVSGRAIVASGSEQSQLKRVLRDKDLDHYFIDIFGSPQSKTTAIQRFVKKTKTSRNFLMIGDSISDMEVALESGVDFLGYTPFSNKPTELEKLCRQKKFLVLNDWKELINDSNR